MSDLRINTIEIRDFRGFPGESVPPIMLGGKNLLLYGENGSGKSTIFQAIRQLLEPVSGLPFNNDLANANCLKHRFTDPASTVGRISLDFTSPTSNSTHSRMTWSIGSDRPTSHPLFPGMARACGLLDYRAVLKTHFLHQHLDGINLFKLIVEELLRDVERPGVLETFGHAWEGIQSEARRWLEIAGRDPSKMDDAEKISYGFDPEEDESEAEEVSDSFSDFFDRFVKGELAILRDRISGFNNSLWDRVVEVQSLANRFLLFFDKSLTIDFAFSRRLEPPTSSGSDPWPGEPELLLRSQFRGELLDNPGAVLNEARLTAIALAFYLAALKVEVPDAAAIPGSGPRLLVLDDVLIGLDMAHRMPVLELLEEEFVEKGWQVLLLTFDRAWYEVAKQRLLGPWQHLELFAIRIGDYEQPLVLEDQDHLYRALSFLDAGQVKAAAVHVRTKFELVLKEACHLLRLPVRYDLQPQKVSSAEFWGVVKSAKVNFLPPPKCAYDGMGRLVKCWQPDAIEQPVLTPELVGRIDHSISRVLNPLSHSQIVDRYRSEIEDAIYAVDELESAIKRAMDSKKSGHALVQRALRWIVENRP